MNTRRYRIAAIVAVLVVALGVLVSRPVIHLISAMADDRAPRSHQAPGHADDASRLNQTKVAETWEIPVASEHPERQFAALLERARMEGLRVSIAGARHSMGGHTIYPGGIVIDMLPFKRMELDAERDILKVQAGAMWDEIIPFLDKHGKSIRVMQSNNSFSVGGSISVNSHGWQYDQPPIASTVESLRLMKADGSVVHCSRDQNRELFSLVLGGYGLFGIILDLELRVAPNEPYRLKQAVVPLDESLEVFDSRIRHQPGLEMVYARINITPERLFDEVILNAFVRDPDGEIPPLSEGGMSKLRRAVFRGSVDSAYGKELRWKAETAMQPVLEGRVYSRNQLLNEGVETFENRSLDSTDIIHEYFVPRGRALDFTKAMRRIIKKHDPDLINVTVRSVNEDEDTFLRYADQHMIAFVMLYVQRMTDAGEGRMKALTRDLIDASLAHGGRHYLPYRLHATEQQFHRAYPQAREFFELKRKHDAQELFQNQFYLKYGGVPVAK